MSTTEATPPAPKSGKLLSGGIFDKLYIAYAIGVAVQLPMLLLYGKEILKRPHYHFAPFAILAVAAIAYSRWPSESKVKFHKSTWSGVLLILGLLCGLASWLFLEPIFTAYSIAFLTSSFLARVLDPETGTSLWACSLPLYVGLILPFGFDMKLITWLQRVSAYYTSSLLDLFGYGHHMPGTVIKIPGAAKDYGIEQACSGVVSFFTLLFVALVFIVWNRRPFFRGLLLMGAAVFWALFMNTVRIFLIPVIDRLFSLDVSTGYLHDILGWSVLLVGIMLLFSTDQFFLFLFGPVETSAGRGGPFGRVITAIWNNILAGDKGDPTEMRRRRRNKPVSDIGRVATWAVSGLLVIFGLLQIYGLSQSWSKQTTLTVNFFETDPSLPFQEGDLPKVIQSTDEDKEYEWNLVAYRPEDRKQGSDLGLRSDVWQYVGSSCRPTASMDQAFPGWHELTTCYINQGWKLVKRERMSAKFTDEEGKEQAWPYIEAHFEKDTGEKGLLLFSHFDSFGIPFDAPAEWGTITSFLTRAANRLNSRVRARLFRGEAYQTQVFTTQFAEFDASVKKEITSQYLKIRLLWRERFLEMRKNGGSGGGSPAADAPAEKDQAKP